MARSDLRSLIVLALLAVLAAAWTAFIPHQAAGLRDASLPLPRIELLDGGISITVPGDASIHYSLDGSEPDASSREFTGSIDLLPDERRIARLIATSTSVQWRHPVGSFPSATVVRACAIDANGNAGPIATRSSLPHAGDGLMVISIALPEGALFDPDSGIYVTGHGIFHDGEISVRRYPEDQRWWKYPGNYQFRGTEWERGAHVEVIRDGGAVWNGDVRLRIHGNNTRGFPQHALRMIFDKPVSALDGRPHRNVVLRAAGNDQDRAFLRDALQHRLCAGLPFETSGTTYAVVYINGAYFGIHEVRERIDEEELALRHGLKKKGITILADRALLYRGDTAQVDEFRALMRRAERMDPASPAYVDSLSERLYLDDFLTYMAAQFILGNSDWPDQNVKYWRAPPKPRKDGILLAAGPSRDRWNGSPDGRWRFIMGDSDLGFGFNGGAEFDLFAHVWQKRGPVARLFNAMMRNASLQDRFRARVAELIDGPLSAPTMTREVEAMAGELSALMPDHIRRWRRPLNMSIWERNIADLQTFAQRRGEVVRRQMDQHLPSLP